MAGRLRFRAAMSSAAEAYARKAYLDYLAEEIRIDIGGLFEMGSPAIKDAIKARDEVMKLCRDAEIDFDDAMNGDI